MIIKVSLITVKQLRELKALADSEDFKLVLQKPGCWNHVQDASGSYRFPFLRESVMRFLNVIHVIQLTTEPRYDVTLEITEVYWLESDEKIEVNDWGEDYAYGYRRYAVHIRFVLQVLAVLDRFMCTRTIRDYAGSAMA